MIRWQVRPARAGLTGFIVSWKDTPAYRRIPPLLERAARKGGLKLAMEYEGLNALRRRCRREGGGGLRFFTSTYAPNPAWYRIGGKPLTIWDGTQRFSRAAVASVTGRVRRRILVLSSGKTLPS